MKTCIALSTLVLIAGTAFADPEKKPVSTPTGVQPSNAVLDIQRLAEAKVVFDRAIAAYKGAKSYTEKLSTKYVQKLSGLPEGQEMPDMPAMKSTLLWAGEKGMAYTSDQVSVYRSATDQTIAIPMLGQYTQGPIKDAGDASMFTDMIEKSPTMQLLKGKVKDQPFPGIKSVKSVKAEELDGKKGMRILAIGESPLPGFEGDADISLFFADETGLLMHAGYDMTAAMQKQMADMDDGEAGGPKPKIDKFEVVLTWTEAVINGEIKPEAMVFKPKDSMKKVDKFEFGGDSEDDAAQQALVGQPAPAISGTAIDGKPISIAEAKGKVVLLDFWATWCGPCVQAIPKIQGLHEQFAEKGLVVIGVNSDDAKAMDKVKSFVEKKKITFRHINDEKGDFGKAYHVSGIPTMVLINKEGVIEKITVGFGPGDEKHKAEMIEKLLKGETLIPKKPEAKPEETAKPAEKK